MIRARRHDCDDGKRLHVERNFAANDVWIRVELRAPDAITDDDLKAIARDLGIEIELTAKLWLDAEHSKVSGCDAETIEMNWLACTGKLHVSASKGCHRFKGLVAGAE